MALIPVFLQNASAGTFPGKNGQIAFVSYKDGNQEIFAMNADGTNRHDLTNNAARDFSPAWSPDGTKIAFPGDNNGQGQIYVMNADGTNPHNISNNAADYDYYPNCGEHTNKVRQEIHSTDNKSKCKWYKR